MQPNDKADELQALLQEEYDAPRLDEPFSASLIARLQAEASAPQSLTPTKPRQPLLAICLAIAAVAASVIAVVWISQPGIPRTSYEVAQRAKTNLAPPRSLVESEIQESRKADLADHMSVAPRSLSLSPESEHLPLSETLSRNQREMARNQSESKHPAESLAPLKEGLVTEERKPRDLSRATILSVLSRDTAEWPNIKVAAALSEMLYVVDSGRLYEVSPSDGSRRNVGNDDWRNTAAMGAAEGRLYIVCDNQLYEVNPATGVRRSVGKPEWANTKAILTAGNRLYIASNGLLHRVNPSDGSHEVLHSIDESPSPPRRPK